MIKKKPYGLGFVLFVRFVDKRISVLGLPGSEFGDICTLVLTMGCPRVARIRRICAVGFDCDDAHSRGEGFVLFVRFVDKKDFGDSLFGFQELGFGD